MPVLSTYFNKKASFSSNPVEDYEPVILVDEDGKQYFDFRPVDYPSIIKSNGKATDWSLGSLVKAGINPDFKISTSFGTRLQGLGQLQSLNEVAEQILSEVESPVPNES